MPQAKVLPSACTASQIAKIGGQHVYAEMAVSPVLVLLRDAELNEYFQTYLDSTPEFVNMSNERYPTDGRIKILEDVEDVCQRILARTIHLRNRMHS